MTTALAPAEPSVRARIRTFLPRGGTLPDDVWRTRHQGILILLWLHVPGLFVFGLATGSSAIHSLFEAAVVACPAVAAWLSTGRRRESTIFAAIGLMTASAVLVHLSGGMIEAHFHFFVMVGVVVLYQDWRPFLIAIGFVVLHHGVVGVFSPQDVYNHEGAWKQPWIWAGVHGAGILAMSAAGIASWKLNERSQSQLAAMAAIVASSQDAIYGWSPDGTITSWNQGATELFGYTAEEIVGRTRAMVPPDLTEQANSRFAQLWSGRRVEPFDTRRVRKDGSLVDVSITISAVRNLAGEIVSGATIARDITDRLEADRALRASEERTRRVIDTARDAFVGIDGAGLITDWNRSAEVTFGWSRGDAVGRPLAETIIPERLRGANDLECYLAAADGTGLDGRMEITAVHRDGHELPVEVAVWWMGGGATQQFSAFLRDITDRKRSERELQQTLSLLAATLESTADGILVVEPDGRISSANRKFAEMCGLPLTALEAQPADHALAPVLDQLADPDAFVGTISRLAGQPDAESDDTVIFRDGRIFERYSEPQRVDGTVVGRVWSFRDVTERTRLEKELAQARDKALESSKLKSEFLATMSHEIRTPMNGVIGLTGLLLDSGLTETQQQYAHGVRTSGEALLGIINDILDFSKIEAGKLELETVDFNLADAVDDVATLVAESARAKGLELVAYCQPEVPTMVRGDVGRLRQILLNLASNAVKFTDKGEVVIRAGLSAPATAQSVPVRIEVIDTGIGIVPSAAERLFEPFSQADASTTRRYGGTGLGLAISRRLSEAMGGTIGVDSVPGHGSTFWVELPFAGAAVAEPKPVMSPGLAGLRVMVVDDNETNRLVLGAQLLAWDITADVAPDGSVALDRLRRAADAGHPYDLALLDMAMPGMNGLELARTVTTDPTLRSVRLILLSSLIVGSEEAARAGFRACLMKPARLSQLHDAILRAIAPPAVKPPVAPPLPSGAHLTRGRLLVVEDNAINQAVAKGIVAKLGFDCDVAGNGVEALQALARRRYDAVLMDCQMPEMDGFEATAEIRRGPAPTNCVPIVAMTAGALVEDRDRCLAAGMDDYMAKPIKAGDLDAILSRVLLPRVGAAEVAVHRRGAA